MGPSAAQRTRKSLPSARTARRRAASSRTEVAGALRPRDGGMWSAALAPRSRRSATAAESARNSYAAPTPAAGDGAGLPFLPALAFVMMPRRAAPVRDALPRRRQLLEGGKRGHARISSPPASIGAFLSSLLGTSPATHGYCCRYREETRCHANPVTIPPGAWWARMRAPTAARTSSSRSSSSPTLFPSSFLHVDRCTRRPRQLILWPPRSLLGLGKGRAVKGEAAPVGARARWMRRGARRRQARAAPRASVVWSSTLAWRWL